MASFRCYDNSDVIATLIMTNFHLNTTVVAIFPNACLWRRSLYSNLVLTLKTNCIKPPSYVSTAYVVVIRPSFLSDSFVKIWATCEIFWGKWFTAPPAKNFPYAYVFRNYVQQDTFWCRGRHTLLYESSRKLSLWKLKMICFWVRTRHVSFRTSKLEHVILFWEV